MPMQIEADMPVSDAELRFFPPLDALPPEALTRVAEAGHTLIVAAGVTILTADDDSHDVYFIREGAVRAGIATQGGHEIIFTDLGVGDRFGELAAIDGNRRSATVVALVRTRLLVIPQALFLSEVLAVPEASRGLMCWLARVLREKDQRLIELVALPVRLRLCAELLRLARTRSMKGAHTISPPPTHHELAARIGTRREVVSREISLLAREGHIATDRRAIRLLHPEVLRAEVRAGLGGGRDD
jgi:CRP-like cAMP-binding protein